MFRAVSFIALAAVLVSAGLVFAQAPAKAPPTPLPTPPKPSLKVPVVKTAPKIDAVLDDAVWKEAATGELSKVSSGAASKTKSKFYIARDDKTLYIAVECFDDPEALKHLAAKVEQHDGFPIWEDDCVEFFVDPSNRRQTYYHFIINSKNVSWDTWDTIPGGANNMGWDPDFKTAVKIGEKSWVVEMALPFAAFDIESDSEAEWAFNLTRHTTSVKENACWSPTLTGSWHVPDRFGTLTNMRKMNLFMGDVDDKPVPAPKSPIPPQVMLLDFEDPAEAAGWSMLRLPEAAQEEPAAKVDLSAEHATSGKHSLKITFDGGEWPAVATSAIKLPENVFDYQTLRLDVTASRPCLVAVRLLQEKSDRGLARESSLTRWNVSASLEEGLNEVRGELAGKGDREALSPKLGKVVTLAVMMYRPRKGDTLTIDNVRISTQRTWPKLTLFKVLGTPLAVSGIEELGAKLNKDWKKPEARSAAEIEAEFAAQFAELKKTHPAARSVLLRQGRPGYDPTLPAKAFDGWSDTHIDARAPDGPNAERTARRGADEAVEAFMRHRGLLMRVDLSSIPKGSGILAARLLLQGRPGFSEAGIMIAGDVSKPNTWVAEACNRPWVEGEANGYQYAADKLWKEAGGMSWDGDDPDFLPIFLAHGPAQTQGEACGWDFTEAVKFWTDGAHPNFGFMLHGDGFPMMRTWTKECKDEKLRPALMVVYEPK